VVKRTLLPGVEDNKLTERFFLLPHCLNLEPSINGSMSMRASKLEGNGGPPMEELIDDRTATLCTLRERSTRKRESVRVVDGNAFEQMDGEACLTFPI
jgi:hypothetical protein